jgi:hypothetical protein
MPSVRPLTLVAAMLVVALAPAWAQDESAEALAKQLSNPIADLVSLPLQFNWEEGVGPDNDLRSVINFQPVVPFSLNENWNLIGRFILPFISQPSLASGADATSGTGDIVLSAFFSPTHSRKAIWGVGPVLGLPTTADPLLGSGKWSVGPTFVILKLAGHWTYGALANHLWSVADTSDIDRTDVNQTYVQPFLAYTTKRAVTFTVASESSANWKAPDGDEWTIPILFNTSKVTKLGPFPFSIGAGAGYFIEKPDGGPNWKLRMTATVILPKKK